MGVAAKVPETGKLNDLQISVLRLFEQGISDAQTKELRQIMMDYFDRALQEEMQVVQEDKQYTQADFDKMLADDDFARNRE